MSKIEELDLTKDFSQEEKEKWQAVIKKNEESAGGSHIITYKSFFVLAPVRDIEYALEILNDRKNTDEFNTIVQAATRFIDIILNIYEKKKKPMSLPGKKFEAFTRAIVLWYASEILAGRATLKKN